MVKVAYDKRQERIWIERDDSSYEATYLTPDEFEMLIQMVTGRETDIGFFEDFEYFLS